MSCACPWLVTVRHGPRGEGRAGSRIQVDLGRRVSVGGEWPLQCTPGRRCRRLWGAGLWSPVRGPLGRLRRWPVDSLAGTPGSLTHRRSGAGSPCAAGSGRDRDPLHASCPDPAGLLSSCVLPRVVDGTPLAAREEGVACHGHGATCCPWPEPPPAGPSPHRQQLAAARSWVEGRAVPETHRRQDGWGALRVRGAARTGAGTDPESPHPGCPHPAAGKGGPGSSRQGRPQGSPGPAAPLSPRRGGVRRGSAPSEAADLPGDLRGPPDGAASVGARPRGGGACVGAADGVGRHTAVGD